MKNKLLSLLNNNLSLYLALRRLIPKSDSPGVVLLPRLAFASILLGVATSILILSLANGLNHSYLKRLAESNSHITLVTVGRGVPAYQEVLQKIKSVPGVLDAYPFTQNEALLKSYDDTRGIVLKAFPPELTKDPTFNRYFQLKDGEWSFSKPRTITIGETLAQNLALFVGNYVEILTYDNTFGAITYRFQISGIFSANDSLLDQGLAYINYDDAIELFGMPGYAPAIGIRVEDYQNPQSYIRKLEKIVPFRFKSWKLDNLNTLLALENEKRVIQVLLLIFFAVAFFGILAVMTALVSDKREEIALLKALGMPHKENMMSFMWTGLFLGISATFIGVILGVFLSWQFNNIIKLLEIIINFFLYIGAIILQQKTPRTFNFLNQNVYYLKEFPVLIQWGDIIFSSICAILCTVCAALYPAHISKEFKPAEILRKRAF